MRTKVKNVEVKWVLLLCLFLFQLGVSANPEKLPKTKSDWMSFDNYKFSGNSSGYTFNGDMHFKRNGVEVDIENDEVVFMKNAYFKTSSSIVKLEQSKLIISTTEELSGLKYNADKIEEKENKLYLVGNVMLSFPNKNTFKADEIIIQRKDSN